MLRIGLNRSEYNYLCQASFINSKHRELILSGAPHDDQYSLEIPEDQADEIRDLCGKQLQISGFSSGYKLTKEGEIIESLVDKLFVG